MVIRFPDETLTPDIKKDFFRGTIREIYFKRNKKSVRKNGEQIRQLQIFRSGNTCLMVAPDKNRQSLFGCGDKYSIDSPDSLPD